MTEPSTAVKEELRDWTMLRSSNQKLCLVTLKFKFVQRHLCRNSKHANEKCERKINPRVIRVEMKIHTMSSYNFTKRRRIQKI